MWVRGLALGSAIARWWGRQGLARAIALLLSLTIGGWALGALPAQATLNDDNFDGNIFALYAGNGSLVPPRVTLAQSRERQRPTLLVFFVDDSRDCKRFSSTISQLQAFYGKAADFLPIVADSLPLEPVADPLQPAHYYRGVVPQTVLIDQSGKVLLDRAGQVSFEELDDRFRAVFNLLPRSESVELRRREVNEVNVELVPEPAKPASKAQSANRDR
ncbi:thylakoid membrane photosystem I accumulation factor [Limnothrix sp. FACHB-1083]|uniref:thylakoid membrane photosystem I accumulation factor n=1 Tax=unclassified Limnothrix TaxID=2632864 RepID=UPI001681862D|nr:MULTISPECIES: thylakoid membrane photosystem I accumulation factor [unclassified Limnothrix]MBD2159168.1 thylakoid membrane photosystem I accumulation factor [Limnothrix sp. FACHB-1083]MBD2191873.1 thylakoid membrane photosystem I accumulation factor [Limnothrix sp. FACHB-1088]